MQRGSRTTRTTATNFEKIKNTHTQYITYNQSLSSQEYPPDYMKKMFDNSAKGLITSEDHIGHGEI